MRMLAIEWCLIMFFVMFVFSMIEKISEKRKFRKQIKELKILANRSKIISDLSRGDM